MDRERQELLTAVELDTPTRRQSESKQHYIALFWTWQLLQISYQIYQMNISDYTSSLCSF